jgi:hypothetical protein
MATKLKGISTIDGRTVEIDLSDLKGSDSFVPSSLFKYNYGSTPTPPPNSSQVRTNTTLAADTTTIWVHRVDNGNVDNKYFLMGLKAGDQLYVQDIDNADSHAIFTLLDDPIDNGSYVTFNVVFSNGGGVPLAGTAVLLGIFA